MAISFSCPRCAKRLRATEKIAGKALRCPGCSKPVKVPLATSTEKPMPAAKTLEIECMACGQRYASPMRHAGKMIPCPECGFVIEVPSLRENASSKKLPAKRPVPSPAASSTRNVDSMYSFLSRILGAKRSFSFRTEVTGRSAVLFTIVVICAFMLGMANRPAADGQAVTPAQHSTATAAVGADDKIASAPAQHSTATAAVGADDKIASAPIQPSTSNAALSTPRKPASNLADLIEQVEPSVVQINTTTRHGGGAGSGFVVDKLGTIVTNYHVIEDATAAEIVFHDGTKAPVIGLLRTDEDKDIAVLRIRCSGDKLRPLHIALNAPRKGEQVAAIGSPLRLAQSVSDGIVSAVREAREIDVCRAGLEGIWIQHTAPISPGNSGGPLVNAQGEVVGMNTWSEDGLRNQNINFAVAAAELADAVRGTARLSPKPLVPSRLP